jgi:regulatory protein
LKSLDIKEEYIDEAIVNYSDEEMLENCEKVFLKYLPSLKKESKQGSKKKIINYLLSRGFSNDVILKVIENNTEKLDDISDEDELLYKLYNKLLKTKKDNIDDKKFKNKVIRSLTSKGFPLYKVLKVLEGDLSYDKK